MPELTHEAEFGLSGVMLRLLELLVGRWRKLDDAIDKVNGIVTSLARGHQARAMAVENLTLIVAAPLDTDAAWPPHRSLRRWPGGADCHGGAVSIKNGMHTALSDFRSSA